MRRSRVCSLVLALGVVAFGIPPVVDGRDSRASCIPGFFWTTRPDSTRSKEAPSDGPYVFCQSDSSSVVLFMCNGSVDRRTFEYRDTLRFRGFCGNTGPEYVIPAYPPRVEPEVFDGVSKILAVSDIHGDYDSFVEILQHTGVIDTGLHWSWGTGHVVVLGDVFDRGEEVTACLWLVYRLEQEAQQAGGRVHYALGNHEVMVLQGDYRYVHQQYLSGMVQATGLAYNALYGPNTVLGRWLRAKHAIVRLNGVLFVHGGLARRLAAGGLRLEQINQSIRAGIDSAPAADTIQALLLGRSGPLWYRGYLQAVDRVHPLASRDAIDSVLSYYGATAIVVGHTEVKQVSGLHDNRVIAIDVPVAELGGLQALLWQDGRFYRMRGDGSAELIE